MNNEAISRSEVLNIIHSEYMRFNNIKGLVIENVQSEPIAIVLRQLESRIKEISSFEFELEKISVIDDDLIDRSEVLNIIHSEYMKFRTGSTTFIKGTNLVLAEAQTEAIAVILRGIEQEIESEKMRNIHEKLLKSRAYTRAYTKEEVRDMFLDEIICSAEYWEKDKGTPSIKDKLQGLAFSILSMLDGESGSLPGFAVMAESSEEDIEYAKEQQVKYFPLESEDIAGNLHERFLALCKEHNDMKKDENYE